MSVSNVYFSHRCWANRSDLATKDVCDVFLAEDTEADIGLCAKHRAELLEEAPCDSGCD